MKCQCRIILWLIALCFFTLDAPGNHNAWGETSPTEYHGDVYYVDTNGNDSNDGSIQKPWRNLYFAVSRVKAGDTVLVNPGRYLESKQISIKTTGEKGKQITIRGNGNGAIIDLSEISDRNGFEVHFANYITIENLTVRASKEKYSRGIRLTHSIGSIIRNNTVYGAGHANLFCSLSDRTVFENNIAHHGMIGIYVADSSDYVMVRGNVLHDNTAIGLHMNGDRNSGGDGTISNALVENNTIFSNGGTGINCDGVTKSIFRNNLLYNNKHRGIAFFVQDGAVPSNDNYVIHNTIIMPEGAYYAIGLNKGAHRNTFYNNIILTEGKVPCFSTTSKIGDLKVVSDYNLLSKNGNIWEIADEAYRFGKWQKKLSVIAHQASRYATEWSSGNDRHSFQAEIGETFANPNDGDFQLRVGSPAIDKGTPKHSFGNDLAGSLRPNGCCPDIGAYEFYVKGSYKVRENMGGAPNAGTSILTSEKDNIHKTKKATSIKNAPMKNKLGMEFLYIPPGSFKMGADSSSKREGGYSKSHQVTLTKGFYMQITEVTQRQWKMLMKNNPSFFKNCGDECPVEQVSWNEIQEFIKRLNEIEKENKYRLPTEAEWEYACRAGTETPFSSGACLSTEQANYCGNYPEIGCEKGIYRKKPVSAKSFPPNAWGLFEMHGNVWEWCHDWLGAYPPGDISDPLGPTTGQSRVFRGGGWNSYGSACHSGNRSGGNGAKRFANLGFRIVKEP